MKEINSELELKTRRRIFNFIKKHPGIHEREISRNLNIPLSTVDYHLHYLTRRNLAVTDDDGHYKKYYILGDINLKEKKLLGALRKKTQRQIIIFLLIRNESPHREICKHLKLAPSTTSFHLNKLVELEILVKTERGRETYYKVKEIEYISDLLISYKKSFLDNMVDRFADSWLELHPKNIYKKKK